MGDVNFWSYSPLILVLTLFFLRVPVAFSLLAASMYYFAFINTTMPTDLALQNVIGSLQSFTLLAVPFFIILGVMMNHSGVSRRLMNFADLLVGHLNGGLGQVNVLMSLFIGGISGSSNADTAIGCKILVPEMVKRGYDKEFCAAVTASSSLLSSIIPPGVVLIVYCMVAKVSVGRLFLAGYLPGFLLFLALSLTVAIMARRRGYEKVREGMPGPLTLLKGAMYASLALFMPFGFLLGIRFGVFTPTEGGAVAVFYCFILGLAIYKELKLKSIVPIFRESFSSTAEVLFIVVGANLFGYYLSWERIPQDLSGIILGFTDNKYVFLLSINILMLIMGMFMESVPAIIILMPLLLEPLRKLDVNLIHFGIVMVLNLQIGGLTPPLGSMMFIVCQMLKLPMDRFIKANIPFLIAIFIVLILLTYVPWIVTFVPDMWLPTR